MSEKGRKKSLMEVLQGMQEKREHSEARAGRITIPEEKKEVYFSMKIGLHEYKVKVWRDGFRGIDVFDTNRDKLYALTFSEEGDGRLLEGWQMKGREAYTVNRKNFGTFASRYADHIQWLARNLDEGVCSEISDLFSLGY